MNLFITLEGPDGGGKSSQAEGLAEYLRAENIEVLLTREPGGSPIGDQIRNVIMELENTDMDARTEFLLFSASRAQHIAEVIRPNLENGLTVISDRFFDSSLAYQGYGQRLPLDTLKAITNFATSGLTPDLTLLLDLPVEEGLRRREADGNWNRMDAYDIDFHRRVRRGYLNLAAETPERWVILNAEQSFAALQDEIRHAVMARLKPEPTDTDK
ncbi:MAG: dTMP kinase [Anaerolineales bacterium]|nr:MAG: dTMP kinase [Anaerolineales bacterium]